MSVERSSFEEFLKGNVGGTCNERHRDAQPSEIACFFAFQLDLSSYFWYFTGDLDYQEIGAYRVMARMFAFRRERRRNGRKTRADRLLLLVGPLRS